MPFDRISRNMLHNKQNRMRIAKGKPKIEDLQEGVPVIREIYTDDPRGNSPVADFLTMYVKHKGKLYENILTKIDDKRSTSAASIAGSQETTITSHLIPEKSHTIDLGTWTKKFRHAYFGGSTIYIGDLSISQSGSGATAKLTVNNTGAVSNDATEVSANNITSGRGNIAITSDTGSITIEQGVGDVTVSNDIDLKVPTGKKIEFFVNGASKGSVDVNGFNGAGANLTGVTGTDATKLPLAGGVISGTLDIDNVLAVGNQSNINTNQGISFDHDQTFTATGSSLSVACLSTLNNHGSPAQNSYTALGFFPGVTTAADVTQITAIYGKLSIVNSGGHTIDQASHIRLRPQPSAATNNSQIYMEGDSDIYCEGDTTFKNKLSSAIGANWTFDATGGVHENLWTTSSTHGLAIGNIVQATTDGGGVSSYGISTNYYVISVPTTTTVILSATSGGAALDASDNSSGNWIFSKQNETKIDGYDLQTSHHSSRFKIVMLTSSFNYGETGGTEVFIPFSGTEDNTTIAEEHCFIAPYSGYIDKVIVRSDEACGSTVVGFYKQTGTSATYPSSSGHSVTVDMAADDTSYVFEFFTARRCTFNEGNVIAISFDPTNDANNTMVTVVFKMNITDPLD